MRIHRTNLRSALRAKQLRPQPADRLEIECENVKALGKRDLLELQLRYAGFRQWDWGDQQGRTSGQASLLRALLNVLRDVLAWPLVYAATARAVTQYRKPVTAVHRREYPQTILFLRTDHWFNIRSGGSVGHLSGVVDGWRGSGYRTIVVSTDRLVNVPDTIDFFLNEPCYQLGRNVPELPEILYNRQLQGFLRSNWSTWAPAFVYQRYSLGNFVGPILKQVYGVPYICEYNGSFPWMARRWSQRKLVHERLLNRIELLNLHSADVVVVVSQAMQAELVSRGIPAANILVNPNGVDAGVYSPSVDGASIRARYALDDKLVIGFIGTFGPWHGAEVLAQAFVELMQDHPAYRERVRLLMIGDGVTLPHAKAIIAAAGLQNCCVFTGSVPQADGPLFLAACDVLASPHVPNSDGTPFFGSPTKLFEYMAMGKGIVASNLDQIGEILLHDVSAFLVEPGSVTDLGRGLQHMIEHPADAKRMGENARKVVIERYTWKQHVGRIIAALEQSTAVPTRNESL